jgi:hypothetical protein
MYKAEVGDDVYREDPTVDQLEREIAAMMGHEAGRAQSVLRPNRWIDGFHSFARNL